jgi:hypothetical protein
MRASWACLAALASAATFDDTEADYTVVVAAGRRDCYFQPMNKGSQLPKRHLTSKFQEFLLKSSTKSLTEAISTSTS